MSTINDLSVVSTVSSADKFPIWSTANGVTRGLPVSVLDGRYITQDQINLLQISPTPEIFSAGDGIVHNTFVPGTTFSLTLTNLYGTGDNIDVFFDGTFQGSDQWSLTAYSLIFTAPIPVGVSKVYVKGGAARITNGLSNGSVTDASVATATKLYNRINDVWSVKDFGTVGNGVADDTIAIQAAENAAAAAGKGLYFPAGTYLINTAGITKKSGVSWFGAGKKLSILKAITATWANSFVSGGIVTNVSFFHLGFDTSGVTTTGFPAAIALASWTGGEIAFCDIGSYPNGIEISAGNGFLIHDNTIHANTASWNISEGIWIRATSGTVGYYHINNNILTNVGMDLDGSDFIVSNNTITGWGAGSGITIEQSALRCIISGNNCSFSSTLRTDFVGYTPGGIESWGSSAVITGNFCSYNAGAGIHSAGPGSTVTGNVCINNGQFTGPGYAPAYRVGIISRWFTSVFNGNSSIIANNVCLDTGTATQQYGYADDGANVSDIVLANNKFTGVIGPMNATGIRYDFKGPELVGSKTGVSGFTLTTMTSGGGSTQVVTGAQLGDIVTVGINLALNGLIVYGSVVSANSVTWNFFNPTGGSVTLAAYTADLKISKPINYTNY